MNRLLRTAVRAGAVALLGRWLADVGPRSGMDLRHTRPVPDEVRRGEAAPAADQLLGHDVRAVGRLADTDPLVVRPWKRRRGSVPAVLVWGGLSALRVRRELAAQQATRGDDPGRAPTTRTEGVGSEDGPDGR